MLILISPCSFCETHPPPHAFILARLIWLLRAWGVSKSLVLIAIHSTNARPKPFVA